MRTDVRVRTIARRDFTPALLGRLHALANPLLAEDAEHFAVHARANDVVHVFERVDTGDLVGFQFWKSEPLDLPGHRAIIGGKLRIVPEHRGRALHLRSGLRFYLEEQLRHPCTRYVRLSLANLFGFVSITQALAEYRLYDPRAGDGEARAMRAALERLCAGSDFKIDAATGLVFVDIHMTAETLARYPPSYFAKPAARTYARVNPGYRENGMNVAFWFRFTPRNLAALARAIWATSRRRDAGRAGSS
jgi:hypothetical protein